MATINCAAAELLLAARLLLCAELLLSAKLLTTEDTLDELARLLNTEDATLELSRLELCEEIIMTPSELLEITEDASEEKTEEACPLLVILLIELLATTDETWELREDS